jgi:hypothetical protein
MRSKFIILTLRLLSQLMQRLGNRHAWAARVRLGNADTFFRCRQALLRLNAACRLSFPIRLRGQTVPVSEWATISPGLSINTKPSGRIWPTEPSKCPQRALRDQVRDEGC